MSDPTPQAKMITLTEEQALLVYDLIDMLPTVLQPTMIETLMRSFSTDPPRPNLRLADIYGIQGAIMEQLDGGVGSPAGTGTRRDRR